MSVAAVIPAPLAFDAPPESVLVIVTRRIGDVLLATPVVRALKCAWPQSAVDMLVFSGTAGFVAGHGDLRRVIEVSPKTTWREHGRLLRTIGRRYDLALSLVPSDRPTLYAFIAGKRRAGLLVDTRKHLWKRALLDAWVPFDGEGTHTVSMHLALLEAVGVAPASGVCVDWTAADARLADERLAPLGGARFAVLHPYPRFRYKMWHEAGWIELAQWLEARGLRVVLTGGSDAAERAYVARLAAAMPRALDLAGALTLGGVSRVLAQAAVYVGPDTAVTHAAAALGVPTVTLFGPSDPVKWAPWPQGGTAASPWQRHGDQRRGNVTLVQGRASCVPCLKEGCERHVDSASACLTELPAARVIAAVDAALTPS